MRIDVNGAIWKHAYFRDVAIGESFHCNGNFWRKRSTKTAVMVRPVAYAGTWFYFRQNDVLEREHVREVA